MVQSVLTGQEVQGNLQEKRERRMHVTRPADDGFWEWQNDLPHHLALTPPLSTWVLPNPIGEGGLLYLVYWVKYKSSGNIIIATPTYNILQTTWVALCAIHLTHKYQLKGADEVWVNGYCQYENAYVKNPSVSDPWEWQGPRTYVDTVCRKYWPQLLPPGWLSPSLVLYMSLLRLAAHLLIHLSTGI